MAQLKKDTEPKQESAKISRSRIMVSAGKSFVGHMEGVTMITRTERAAEEGEERKS